MTDHEMELLFHEAEHGRRVTGHGRFEYTREAFTDKVRLAEKYISQFWAEPIPQVWLDSQEAGMRAMIERLKNDLAEVDGDESRLPSYARPGGRIRVDAGVLSPVALHMTRTLEDYRHPEIEHPRLRAIRYMEEAAIVMAEEGDEMAIPHAEYVKFVMKKDEDFDWESGRQGGAAGDYSLRGAPWGNRDGLPISMDEYNRYQYTHTYADFFPGSSVREWQTDD